MFAKILAEMPVIFQLLGDLRLFTAGPNAGLVANRRVGQRAARAVVNEIARGRIEVKSVTHHTSQECAKLRSATPALADHRIEGKLSRHYGLGSLCRSCSTRGPSGKIIGDPGIQLGLRAGRRNRIGAAEDHQFLFQPVPGCEFVHRQSNAKLRTDACRDGRLTGGLRDQMLRLSLRSMSAPRTSGPKAWLQVSGEAAASWPIRSEFANILTCRTGMRQFGHQAIPVGEVDFRLSRHYYLYMQGHSSARRR
jgi:hypothetical protein